ncbi:splicing factor-like protein 1 [Cornus florida]|uniref:splicing factor-like protein 1 n=1 Tax=Cornus florida TaxID=4283 RepID=UPI00289B83E6|nr:splicing factor-like protein 1 [Cornus florida]
MEKETGARIFVRGKGCVKTPKKADPSDDEDLHVYIKADNQESLDAANEYHKQERLEEPGKLNGKHRDDGMCSVCRGKGHKHYACPNGQPNFKMAHTCATCGSFCHPISNCPLTVRINNSLSGSSGGFGSTPNINSKTNKEIRDTILYVGSLPQTMDELQLTELLPPFGKLIKVKINRDCTTSSGKGYGIVAFENPIDAALAVKHMNGYKLEGKMLAVRLAGHPPVATSSVFSHLPMYSINAAVPSTVLSQTASIGPPPPPTVPSQTASLGPPGSMLPGSQASFIKSEASGLPSSSIYLGHCNHLPKTFIHRTNSPTSFCPGSLDQFPGDPDYPGSQFQSYFATPSSMLPGAQASFLKSEGLALPPPSIYMRHCNQLPKSEALDFPPPVISSIPDSRCVSSFNSSYRNSIEIQPLYPSSLEQFPGNPDYPSSQSR